jgi:hypothetical protein
LADRCISHDSAAGCDIRRLTPSGTFRLNNRSALPLIHRLQRLLENLERMLKLVARQRPRTIIMQPRPRSDSALSWIST